MSSYNENYRRIREEYDTKYRRAQEAADLRRAEVHLTDPEIEALDRQIRGVGLKLMQVAMEGGDVSAKVAEVRRENEELRRQRAALMVANGFPADYTEVKYDCPACADSGFVEGKMCLCMKKKLATAAMESSGMADLVKTQSFENFSLEYYQDDPAALRRMEQILRKMKEYATAFDPAESGNLVLFGGTGLGKTHLSSALAKVIMERGYDVFYATAVTLLSDFEYQRFGNGMGEPSGRDTDRYFDCDLLIIDDLGTEMVNQFTTSVLYNIINTRLTRHKPTIISTNLTQGEFRERYWDRITSRVLGEYTVLPFLGQDIRAQRLKK